MKTARKTRPGSTRGPNSLPPTENQPDGRTGCSLSQLRADWDKRICRLEYGQTEKSAAPGDPEPVQLPPDPEGLLI